MTQQPFRIGVDLGGTKIEAIAMDASGETLARRRAPTPAHDYVAILQTITALVRDLESEIGGRGSVGLGTPGVISPRTGLVKNSNTTGLNGKPLDKDLAALLGRPVRIENDANCFALSEAVDGAGAGGRVVFGVILGTGVGGGLVVEGKALQGVNKVAGEWGHTPLPWMTPDEFPGRLCYCGHYGCVETFLSGPALAYDYGVRSGQRLCGEEIAVRAAGGEAAAIDCLDVYRDRLSRALAAIINLIDPDVIVLGGGVSNIDRIYDGLFDLVERQAFSDAIDTKIVRNRHGDASGVRGAAWLWGGPGAAARGD
ncbi:MULTISPECIES: ROK family protein [Methylosinus]|uniref:Transcriptional regulator n=1 Tax=Methylosinus trichosporium (strain ATCC 35070 / NCIMB 11131 / UNIQEM 75 / OB3b) TaxID=595536 RepID=A0A2D2D267_METT3|nr:MULTISPECIES: ROK family protein [Methylosinus]ATQ69097.1 transcriptional regulator [Methylosinus trichosporium OB3b]OBS54228.1 transcriptional regulator [Methylosinus sp. 3S-1]